MRNIISIWLLVLMLFYNTGCKHQTDENTIRIIHAGSLALVVKQAIEAFNNENPDITIYTEAWGSKDGARQITELRKPCDVYISADVRIISDFLIPEFASWSIPFAGNEMVLAYLSGSKFSEEINANNWCQILSRDDVYTARSSPDADPCGVRAVHVMQLSNIYYNDNSISNNLLNKDLQFMRPKEADLIALLEKRTVDYIYIYRSLAVQHGFNYIRLPKEINLSDPSYSDHYSQSSFYTAGRSPKNRYKEVGSPILYGLTIPTDSKNRLGAKQFIQFLLDEEKGGKILERNGQNFLVPEKTDFYEKIPIVLKEYVIKK